MKKLCSLLFVAFLSTLVAEGATFNQFVGFGSVSNAITQYAVPRSKGMTMGVYQNTPSGPVDVKSQRSFNINFNTKDELDAFFRQQVTLLAEGALTNYLVDKDKPFRIFAVSFGSSPKLGIIDYLYYMGDFSLVKSANNYELPSFSTLSMILTTTMIFEIPGLEWGRIETSSKYRPSAFSKSPYVEILFELDSRYPQDGTADMEISIKRGCIAIATELATAGTNSSSALKVSLVIKDGSNHQFKVFGPLGTQIPETAIVSENFQFSEGRPTFEITGGDTGRVLMVQSAPSPSGPWTDSGEKMVVPRGQSVLKYEGVSHGSFEFYRVRTSNDVPF